MPQKSSQFYNGSLSKDLVVILLSIIFAVFLVKTDIIVKLIASTQELKLVGSFVSGMFFTSVLTTAPAIVALGEISKTNSLFLTALCGAIGAVVGDLIIFRFVRDRVSSHVMEILSHQTGFKRFKAIFRLKTFRWMAFLLGGLIIASPLPDELGISLLGFSKMKTSLFIGISFVFNFVGIILIGLLARTI